MRSRFSSRATIVLAVVSCTWLLASAHLVAQSRPAGSASTGYTPPRTPDGQPDLQGVWDYRTVTPLERPDDLAGKAVLTDAEVGPRSIRYEVRS